ncbi:dTDP-4-dehydrorhamnose reductase [Vibrio breoganii]
MRCEVKVLVVGCNGQVGRALLERMPEEVELLAVDRQTLNITEASNVEGVISEFKPQFVINAAGYTNVDQAELERELCYSVNCDGARNLAISSRNVDATFIHLSTDYVFAGDKVGQYAETDLADPLNAYGLSKLVGEEAVRETNAKHIIVRTSWVFGEHGNNFVKTMLRLGSKHGTLSVVGDQYGGPTYAGDIGDCIITILQKLHKGQGEYGTFHFSGTVYVSWAQFADVIFDLVQSNNVYERPEVKHISTAEYSTRVARPANSTLCCDKIWDTFRIRPSDWQNALTDICNYMEPK